MELEDLMKEIRRTTLYPMFNKLRPDEIRAQFCLAMYSADRTYYRGYVKSVDNNMAEVHKLKVALLQRHKLE